MTAPIDYNAVLADLIAKRGQIDAAIEVIRSLIGSGATPETPNGDSEGFTPSVAASPIGVQPRQNVTALENDSFFGLTTAQAVKRYLAMIKRPQAPRLIAEAIRLGGQVHATDEETAYRNVYTALTRNPKEFVKTRTKEWGLADWYPNQRAKETDE